MRKGNEEQGMQSEGHVAAHPPVLGIVRQGQAQHDRVVASRSRCQSALVLYKLCRFTLVARINSPRNYVPLALTPVHDLGTYCIEAIFGDCPSDII